jgi:glycosyltransferase involved in cell wall biosynthesis
LLVPQGDAGALHAALSRLALDPSERERLGEAGHAVALRDFDEALPAQRALDLYRTLLAEKRERKEGR